MNKLYFAFGATLGLAAGMYLAVKNTKIKDVVNNCEEKVCDAVDDLKNNVVSEIALKRQNVNEKILAEKEKPAKEKSKPKKAASSEKSKNAGKK